MQQIQITKTVPVPYTKGWAPFLQYLVSQHHLDFGQRENFLLYKKKHQRIQLNTALTYSRVYGHENKFYKLQDYVLRHPISVKGRALQRDNVPKRRGRGKKRTVKVL
jgi:hypothetical protein